ncbi:hypothetical protein [Streptomyces sp. NPDC056672]|uniref:hypothetical protein n=1 Tax=Streptomyces sp. NPDC056672 TaxID=3345906 RepID=UPI00369EA0D4
MSLADYERHLQERAAARQRELEAAARKEAKAAERRKQAADKRRKKEADEAAAAEEMRGRIERIGVERETGRAEPYDKGLSPYGQRMRLVQVDVLLRDGSAATWWDVEVYGGRGPAYGDEDLYEEDKRGGRFHRLSDARTEYQRHRYETVPYQPPRRRRDALRRVRRSAEPRRELDDGVDGPRLRAGLPRRDVRRPGRARPPPPLTCKGPDRHPPYMAN